MNAAEKIIRRIRKFVKQSGMSRFRLASESGLAMRTLRDLDKPTFNPTFCTLSKTIAFIEQHEKKR